MESKYGRSTATVSTLLQIARDHHAAWRAVRRRSTTTTDHSTDKEEESIASTAMLSGAILTFIGFALLFLSFSTPNW
ncbi:hypothetical protein RvY_13974 [Ramazzottius varieornatus]|uniref:Uncharacterized protein n=1 Tax=Ramazzottius varieornatus TaxID=947166 RepID=A0A1D1VPS7_RAMVA|nr:hypothetical protein RvY_13974 [Ramazzottius varieornatus]